MEYQLSKKQLRQLAEMTAEILLPKLVDALNEGKPLLNTKEKAKQLGISEGTLRHWVADGRIDAIKQGTTKQAKLLFRS